MSATPALAPHPRLHIGPPELANLAPAPATPLALAASKAVSAYAEECARSPVFEWELKTHNAHLIRARRMQERIVTLLVEWVRTSDRRFRDAAVAHVREMGNWEYWSWITWRKGEADPNAIFDLSYGENSATLAIAYDVLAPTLSRAEKKEFLDIARRRALRPCLRHTRPAKPMWWLKRANCNWLSVCAGGAGMLCMATWEDLPEARQLLPRLDGPITEFMKAADAAKGGWYEGLSYWNYGMRYAFMYLLSHERAFRRPHPAMKIPGTKQTLSFCLDFSPHGCPCAFGDINVPWRPLPFHYAAATRFGLDAMPAALDARLDPAKGFVCGRGWPDAAEYLLFRRHAAEAVKPTRKPAEAGPLVRLYPVLDWALLADRMPSPRLYAAVRGGTMNVPHAHQDLLSWHAVVGDEQLVTSISNAEYIDTTFSERRYEVYEMSPAAKNTILVGGVGITRTASVTTAAVRRRGLCGVRMDASSAIDFGYHGEKLVRGVWRLIAMLDDKALLVVDRVALTQPNRAETRLHSHASVEADSRGALLRGARHSARLAFACSVPSVVRTSTDAPTSPASRQSTIVRCMTERLHTEMAFAALLVPGKGPARVAVSEDKRGVTVTVAARGLRRTLRLSLALMPRG